MADSGRPCCRLQDPVYLPVTIHRNPLFRNEDEQVSECELRLTVSIPNFALGGGLEHIQQPSINFST